jgi:dTMP kinase
VIKPALEEGKIVICDRFSGSTFAYQLGGRKLDDADQVKAMDAYARQGVTPDLVIYLDVDPKTGIARKQDGDELFNRMDAEAFEFHQRVREYFLTLAKQENWLILSTQTGTRDENAAKIYDAITQRIQL